MSRSKAGKDRMTPDQRRLALDLAFSRAVVIGSVVLLAVVVIADALYVVFVPRHNGHLVLPAIVFVGPLVAVLLVVLTMWNWRAMRRRGVRALHASISFAQNATPAPSPPNMPDFPTPNE